MGFSPKILGLNIGNFLWEGRNWPWDSVPIFWDRILEIFETVLGSPELCLKVGFYPGTDVLGFCCVLLLEKK